jgi:cytochrome P450
VSPGASTEQLTSSSSLQAPPSPAGPVDPSEPLNEPPSVTLPRAIQTLRFTQRQIQFVFRSRRELGDVFKVHFVVIPGGVVVTSHPDHVRSLFTAKPGLVPSLTAESPLRPIVGPNSVLTANGPSHLRQRKLLLPPFHGEAIEHYAEIIRDVTERELDRWPVGRPFALAPKMQAITLDVIMSGIFGIEGRPARGTAESGCPSVAAHVAASARRWRWPSSGWCWRRWSDGSICRPIARSPSTPSTAT